MAFRSGIKNRNTQVAPQVVSQNAPLSGKIESVNLDDLTMAAQFFSPGPLLGNGLIFQWTKQVDLNDNFELNNTGQHIIIKTEGTYSIDLSYDYLGTDTSADEIQLRSPPSSNNYIMCIKSVGTRGVPSWKNSSTQSSKVFQKFLHNEKFDVFSVDGPQGPISNIRLNIMRIGL